MHVTLAHVFVVQNGAVPSPIKILRVITRLNIGGPAIHAILLTQALNDGAAFQSTLVTGTTAPHEGDMLDFARARAVEPVVLPALGREISPSTTSAHSPAWSNLSVN